MLVKRRRHILGLAFEVWLVGDDQEQLCAVGDTALAEAARVEHLLGDSPASRLSQINREAGAKAVPIDHEMLAVLTDCVRWFGETAGGFDPGLATLAGAFPATVVLDAKKRTVRFRDPKLQLDLNHYVVGYALDAAACVLEDQGLENALLWAGERASLSRGHFAEDSPWSIPLANPFDERLPITTWIADDNATATARLGDAACCVVAPTALEAAVFAGGLRNLGRDEAARLVHAAGDRLWRCQVAWLERGQDVVWLRAPGP